jgi:hypothetical protein
MKRQTLLRTSAVLGAGAIATLFFVGLVGCSESAPPPPAAVAAQSNPVVTRTITVTVNKVDTKGVVSGQLTDAAVAIDKTATMEKVNGKTVFTVPKNDTYSFSVTKAGYLSVSRTVKVDTNVSADIPVAINMTAMAAPVTVTVNASTGATTKAESIAAAPADATPAQIAAAPKLEIPTATIIKVNDVVQTAPVAITVTPVPASAVPVAAVTEAPSTTAATTTTSQAPLGGFVLEPAGLTTSQPMTLNIPLSAYELDDATAAELEKGDDGVSGNADDGLPLEIVDPNNPSAASTVAVKGHYKAPAAGETVGHIEVTFSNFATGKGRAGGRSIMTLNLPISNTITPGSVLLKSAQSDVFGGSAKLTGQCSIGMSLFTAQLVPVRLRMAQNYMTWLILRYSYQNYINTYNYTSGTFGPTSGLKYFLKAYQYRYHYRAQFGRVFFAEYWYYGIPQIRMTTETYVAPPKPAGTSGGGGNT